MIQSHSVAYPAQAELILCYLVPTCIFHPGLQPIQLLKIFVERHSPQEARWLPTTLHRFCTEKEEYMNLISLAEIFNRTRGTSLWKRMAWLNDDNF